MFTWIFQKPRTATVPPTPAPVPDAMLAEAHRAAMVAQRESLEMQREIVDQNLRNGKVGIAMGVIANAAQSEILLNKLDESNLLEQAIAVVKDHLKLAR